MASLLRRSKLWDSFVPPPGFESPRTAELKFLIFFARMSSPEAWWHPTEVATRVGSSNHDTARLLCLKLARSGWLNHAICHIQSRSLVLQTYTLVALSGKAAYDKRAADFAVGFNASAQLRDAYHEGNLLGMFRIAKGNRRPLTTRIFEYLVEHPEPIRRVRLASVIRAKNNASFFQLLRRLITQRRLSVHDPSVSTYSSEYQMTASEWLRQETKRRQRAEQDQEKKAKTLRKRRRTLKKKAKKRKRPSRRGALEL